MSEDQVRKAIAETLDGLLTAMKSEDIEQILALWGSGGDSRRDYYQGLIDAGIMKDIESDTSAMEVDSDGKTASAGPVTYRTSAGEAAFRYTFEKDGDAWLIASGTPAQQTMAPITRTRRTNNLATTAKTEFLADAGLLVDNHAMIWLRHLNAPIERVWEAISTKEGLETWWLVPPSKFQLRKGGAFNHHWNNTVVAHRKHKFIDFGGDADPADMPGYAGTGGMRFEVNSIDDANTAFMFLDAWGPGAVVAFDAGDEGEQPGGTGTPWPGVAAGWHMMVDRLVEVIDGRAPPFEMPELIAMYVDYLRDMYRLNAMVQGGPNE